MRYFYVILLLLCVTVLSVAGFRGAMSRRQPLELFSDMTRQPKVRPQSRSDAFVDKLGSRPRPPGTIPTTEVQPTIQPPIVLNGRKIEAWEDLPVNTGRLTGSTNWVEINPLPITMPFLERGRDRFEIFCIACHGASGDGRGITSRYNMAGMANFHDRRLIDMTDGELFNTVTHGKNLMGSYGPVLSTSDRWAIIGYIRALQRSRLAGYSDVPEEMQKLFK